MLKIFWSVIWRSGTTLVVLFIFVQSGQSLSTHLAKTSLTYATANAKEILSHTSLVLTLNSMTLQDLTIRDRASVDARYLESKRAQADIAEDINLTNKQISALTLLFIQPLQRQSSEELNGYNDLMRRAEKIFRQAQPLFDYYQESSLALYNILYYNPVIATQLYEQSHDANSLRQSFGRAQDGLEKTAQRLEGLPDFDDATLKSFIPIIRGLASQAKEITRLSSVDVAQSHSLAVDFNLQVKDVQNDILADRRKFWVERTERRELITQISAIYDQLQQEKIRLGGLVAKFK